MKIRPIIILVVCFPIIVASSIAAASSVQTSSLIDRKDQNTTPSSERPHPVITGKSTPILITSKLRPSTAKEVGMVAAPLQQIDSVMKHYISQKFFPGAVAFAARGGRIVKHTAYGYSARYKDNKFTELDNPIAMKKNTIFDLASISKIFTTVAIMQLYDRGLFGLDDPVAKYIPEFASVGKQQVTIRQLLTHRSGLAAGIPLYAQGRSREDRLRLVFQQRLKSMPGTNYEYSDLNMITLGALIEKLSGQRQDIFVKENITDPLGMRDTMYNPPKSLKKRIAATEYQPLLNRGLVWGEVHDENAWALDGVAGHAGVFSTAEDLAKLAHVFINRGNYGEKRILRPETVKLLLENQNEGVPGHDHGLGWELGQNWYMGALSEGTYTFGHTGYTGTSIVVNPNTKTVAILLTNRVHPSRSMGSINEPRRLFARSIADAIPVTIPGRGAAWFAGYGNKLNRMMEADLHLKEDTMLTFVTWHMMEEGWDYGFVELLRAGAWKKLAEFTGTSKGWETQKLLVPKDAKMLRFVYRTDSSINKRGWYVLHPKLGEKKLTFSRNSWQLRDY
ncbi:serine hydrolase domain-containing protein [Neobacillus dielmonensis]|uniref:serine hydrolase domain-containing protein n=1 Tax=Neobacillus dielmonensis TaxID=1347369 RepID=UPI0005A8E4C9|nr:serine hydrolase domain-containing protein [Neobacillus dielmonensis]